MGSNVDIGIRFSPPLALEEQTGNKGPVDALIEGLRNLRDEYDIRPGKCNDRDRRRIALLVSDLFLGLEPDVAAALLGRWQVVIAGPRAGHDFDPDSTMAVALFERELYRALQKVNLRCSPIEAEGNFKAILQRTRDKAPRHHPLQLHDIGDEADKPPPKYIVPTGNRNIWMVKPGSRKILVEEASPETFAVFESEGYKRAPVTPDGRIYDPCEAKREKKRLIRVVNLDPGLPPITVSGTDSSIAELEQWGYKPLSAVVIAVLRGEHIEKEETYAEQPTEQELVGASVGTGALGSSEWDFEREDWGI